MSLPAEQPQQAPVSFDPDILRRMYAKDCTNDEFAVFLGIAQKYELDPALHQIWAVKYGNSAASFIVGRDGLLDIAHRNPNFDGFESGTEGSVKEGDLIGWCKVYRKDMSHPFTVTVDYGEYVATDRSGKPTTFWGKMPKTMIKKVAQAQAFRQAFKVYGVYCEDEMPPAPREIPDSSAPARDNPNKCVSCGNVINPEHIEKVLLHTNGVPMCDPCFSNWYHKKCAAKLEAMAPEPAEVVDAPAEVIAPEPEPVTLVMCAECGNAVEPGYEEFTKEKTGKAMCQKCFEAWASAPKTAPKAKSAAPVETLEKSTHWVKHETANPAATVTPKTICQGCGKVIAPGTTHCQACIEKEMGQKAPAAPKPAVDGPVCKACGATLTKKEIGFSTQFLGADGPLCSGCTGKLQRNEL